MVKKFLCCFLVFVFLFSTCSVGLAEGETDSGKVTVYDLSPQQFWGFMVRYYLSLREAANTNENSCSIYI